MQFREADSHFKDNGGTMYRTVLKWKDA